MKKKKHMVSEEPAGYENGAIVLYQTPDGSMSIDVRLEKETLWMDAHQMARLFGRDRSVIVRHILKIYGTNELDRNSTCAKNAQVAADGRLRQMDLYNLDVIIGVGYRVNSRRGTQFRIWAMRVLREYLTRGVAINRQRLEINAREIEAALELARRAVASQQLTTDMGRGLVEIIARYTQTFLWLQRSGYKVLYDKWRIR
jgi:hypothetical protein